MIAHLPERDESLPHARLLCDAFEMPRSLLVFTCGLRDDLDRAALEANLLRIMCPNDSTPRTPTMTRLQTLLPSAILRAMFVGACFVLVTASTARASSISCGFGGSVTDGPGCTHIGGTFGQFDFGPYALNLFFE